MDALINTKLMQIYTLNICSTEASRKEACISHHTERGIRLWRKEKLEESMLQALQFTLGTVYS